jgi:mRNA-degrading endonuclease toxin of MazEF toxin-antitoxin module
MLDALKTLFENNVVSEEIRAEIEEAWEARVTENRKAATAELREEFAQKYEHDKAAMVEAVDAMLSERLAEEIAEFAEDRKQLAEAKAKYAVAMRENADLMKNFVIDQLGKEVSELHEDQKAMAENFSKLEEFIVEALAKEIAEFHEDKKDLAETKVRLVREAKSHFAKVKTNFIERSAKAVSETVSKTLTKEIGQLKEDIEVARRNDFGRKLFEAFASEYAGSYLNEKSEVAKLMKVVEAKDKQLDEAKAFAAKAKTLAESVNKEKTMLIESAKREKTINELIAPLNKDQKEIMMDLLESVQTAKLSSAFDKYLPTVIDGNTPAKQKAPLTEGKEVTGNRDTQSQTNVSRQAGDSNVLDIRRLAGIN